MIKPIRELSVEVVPQAIVGLSVSKVVGKFAQISEGRDELDLFEGASFKLDDEIELAVRHYRAHPKNTSTIYIDRKQKSVKEITKLIRKILKEFGVSPTNLKWERKRDPDL